MSWMMPASIIGSSLLGGFAANRAGESQADAATRAAQIQAEASRYAADLQQKQYDQNVARQQPFYQAGVNALPELVQASRYTPFGQEQFQADPGYAFRMSEGMKALERSAAARGGLLSGATLRGTQRYGQDLASQEYQNAFNRYQTERTNTLNPFQSLAGVAQTSANTLGGQAGAYGANVGNLMSATGASNANALLAGGNARASAYQGYGTAAGQAIQGINSFFRNQGTPSYSGPSYGSNPDFDNSFYDTMSYD